MSRGEEMEEKKAARSWTISDELWEEVKEYIPKKQRDPKNIIRKRPGKDAQVCRPNRCWRASFMFCGLGANGKQFHENMGAAAVFTGIFKNGKQQVSLKGYGYWVWKNTMS